MMTNQLDQTPQLEDVRRAMDGIDDALLDLLERRIACLTAYTAGHKWRNGGLGGSAFRPAREAAILRRLLSRPDSLVPPELLVRLWRNILARSAQNQADITVHISKKLNASMGLRLRIRDYFGTLPVEEYRDEAQALMQVNASPADICIVETESRTGSSLSSPARPARHR